jgi:hypothetical protein
MQSFIKLNILIQHFVDFFFFEGKHDILKCKCDGLVAFCAIF